MKKKVWDHASGSLFPDAFKILLKMKLTLSIILLSIFGAIASESYSQSKKLSLDLKNETVENVLETIESKSDFYFLYSAEQINVDRKVDINVKESSIEPILEQLFAGTNIGYNIKGRQIVLSSEVVTNTTQQPRAISGKVTDSSGSPLPGVTVVVKGSTSGTITDANGNYSLSNVSSDATIQFSFIGMKAQEVAVAGKTTLNVRMQEDNVAIEEVVAVGYGTMKKIELTSSVSSVKSTDFIKGSITDAAQLIKGKVAGVTIVTPDASPTGTSQILLRGVGTLRSGTQPLVLIDGVPGGLNDVASDDIESFDILKDGSASAIYGTRGNNGVILITTKKVKGETPATIEYHGYVTTQSITKKLEFMNADQYRKLVAQGKPGAFDYGADTDWMNAILQTPVSHTHNVSMKGGNDKTNYVMNVNYRALEGMVIKSNNDVMTLRFDANHSMLKGKLKINGGIMVFDQKRSATPSTDAYKYALSYNPTDPIKNDNGNWTEHLDNNYRNPVSLIYETSGVFKGTNTKPYATITVLPLKDLTLKAQASRNIWSTIYGYSESNKHINSLLNSRTGYASREAARNVDDLLEITGNYYKSIGKHTFNILGGYSYQEEVNENFNMNNYNFSSDYYTYNNMGNGAALSAGKAGIGSNMNSSKLVSYFVRGNYNYADKYMVSTSIRYDGCSKFGKDHKWGTFPAVSAGWNIINEPFMEGVKSTLSILKVRGGFSVTGTAPSDNYASLDRLTTGSKYLYNGTWLSVIYPSTNANPDLRWEKKEETNIGLDFGIFDNRISGSIDVYKRTNKDLLWNYNVPKPPYLHTTILANAGTMENKGIELKLDFIPVQTKNLTWNTSWIYSTNKNKLVSLSSDNFVVKSGYFDTGGTGEPIQTSTHRVQEGNSIGDFYGYKSVDIDDDGYWIIEGEDGTPKSINDAQPDDKKILGNGLPKHYLNWNNILKYREFDLNITMRGAFGFDILNFAKMYYSAPIMLTRGNVMTNAYDNVYGKRPLADDQALYYVSYYLENGNYWKIDNITLGYTHDLKVGLIKSLRIYASGSNLFTITGYSGLDPEVNSLGLNPGNDDRFRYPSARMYTFGLSVKF